MAVLNRKAILNAIAYRGLNIKPLCLDDVQEASVTLHVSNVAYTCKPPKRIVFTEGSNEELESAIVESEFEEFVLGPGEYAIFPSREEVTLPETLCGRIFTCSDMTIFGFDSSLTEEIFPGESGQVPIILRNIGKSEFVIRPGDAVCQLMLQEVVGEIGAGNDKEIATLAVALRGKISVE